MPSLSEAHILLQERLRSVTTAAVAAAWTALSGYDEEDVDPFVEQVAGLVLLAQARAVALTDAYLARALGRGPLGLVASDLSGAAVRNGTTPEQEWRRPFVTVWTALGKGSLYEAAVATGLARAKGMAAADVQLSHRAAYGATMRADPKIKGFQRVADSGACDFCNSVNGAFVKSASAMALHNGCGCGLRPVLREVAASPVPETVAEHEHGEMGLVLTDPAHGFTAASDF